MLLCPLMGWPFPQRHSHQQPGVWTGEPGQVRLTQAACKSSRSLIADIILTGMAEV